MTLRRGITYDTVVVKRVVLDTNVFVSALRSQRGASHRVLLAVAAGDIEIALSVPLVLEYEDAAKRTAREIGLSSRDVDDVLDYMCSVAHLQAIHFLWRPVLKDPRDDHVLELAVEAGCEVVVTHNTRDFAGSERFGVRVVTPKELMRSIGGRR